MQRLSLGDILLEAISRTVYRKSWRSCNRTAKSGRRSDNAATEPEPEPGA